MGTARSELDAGRLARSHDDHEGSRRISIWTPQEGPLWPGAFVRVERATQKGHVSALPLTRHESAPSRTEDWGSNGLACLAQFRQVHPEVVRGAVQDLLQEPPFLELGRRQRPHHFQ